MSQDSEDRSDRSRWLGIVQSAAILVLIVLALYLARAPDRVERQDVADPAIQSGIPSVQVIRPEPTEQSLGVRLTGSVRLERKARVVSEVMGRVVWVSPSFSNGGSIPAGETFLRIDPAEYRLRVESAQAAVSEARAAGGSMLALAQTALKLAELQLRRTDISLPYDSRVVSSDVEVGELVGPSEQVGRDAALGVVYRAEALLAEAPIELAALESLSPVIGRSARLTTGRGSYDAEVVRVSSVVAPKTRLATLFLKFTPDVPLYFAAPARHVRGSSGVRTRA